MIVIFSEGADFSCAYLSECYLGGCCLEVWVTCDEVFGFVDV